MEEGTGKGTCHKYIMSQLADWDDEVGDLLTSG